MGFECGFNKFPVYKDTTVDEFLWIKNYLYWKNNPWNFEERNGKAPYPTYKDYWMSEGFRRREEENYPGEPDPDKVAFYQDFIDKEDDTIDYWCSIGRHIDDFVRSELTPIDDDPYYYKGIDLDFVKEAQKWVEEELEENKLIPVTINRGYVITNKEDRKYIDEDDQYATIAIDGVEIEDDDGNIRRLDAEGQIYVAKGYFDDELNGALNGFKDTLYKIKDLLREGEYQVYYYGGY